ncbi:MAG: Mth938-like domain-containing protein [Gemmataceae bacterium]
MSQSTAHSPRVLNLEWGKMTIEDIGEGRDFKLWPGGGREWDWAETDTHHVPGIQPGDVQELLDKGSRVVVLSQGMKLRLQTCPETKALLEARGIVFHIEETTEAVRIYNELVQRGEAVGGLFHSTC